MKHSVLATKIATVILPAALLVGCYGENSGQVGQTDTTQSSESKSTSTSQESGSGSVSATTPSLGDQLADKAKTSAAKAPAALRSAFKSGIDVVRDSGIEKSAKQVGDAAIDGELIGWDGQTFKLSELWNDGPIILMWYRGGWCPYCNLQLRAMQQSLDSIENAGARLVVLTPELPEKAKETADANDLEIVALHDKDNQLAQQFGIMFDLPDPIVPIYRDKLKLNEVNGSNKLQLPLAATYVIDKSGTITYAFLDADYKKRAEPTEVVDAVKLAASE